VRLGEFARGGLTRGAGQACDHDGGCQAQYIPWGLVAEDTGQLSLTFGRSATTSDLIVAALAACWDALPAHEQHATAQLQLKLDKGPESSGVRTHFRHRRGQFADQIGNPIPLLYYPPYHSKYNPLERCWGMLELHWDGALLREVEPMLAGAQRMTWKGRSPVVALNHKEYPRGLTLSQETLRTVEGRLERHPELPQWDILIHPAAPD